MEKIYPSIFAHQCEALIQHVLDAIPMCCFCEDESLNPLTCNEEAVRLFGLSSKQEYLEKFHELHPCQQQCGSVSSELKLQHVKTAFETGRHNFEWMYKTPDEKAIPAEVSLTRIEHDGRHIVVGAIRDLRELKEIRNKAQEADGRVQIMFDAMPLCATFWNSKLEVIDCNREAVKLFGLSNKQEYLDRFHELSPKHQPDGQLSYRKAQAFVEKTLAEGTCRFEWTHQKLNGEPVPCEITLVRVEYLGEPAVLGYARDLREQKAMLREMRRVEIAEASNKAKSRFLAMMSHEIRTPMNVILGTAEVQLQDGTLSPTTREAFHMLYGAANSLLRIINDILDLSKIEAGKLELLPAKYELASLLNDTVQLNLLQLGSKPVEFKLVVDANTPVSLYGDEVRVRQILSNLVSNAFKYTKQGTVELAVSAETKIEESGPPAVTLIFRVSDTGQGMTAAQVRALFDEYSRFDADAHRGIEGTGLGMNITQHLIRKMHGELFVDSRRGKGTEFTVRLPQGGAGPEVFGKERVEDMRQLRFDHMAQAKNAQIVREPMPYGKVLIVDDLETNIYVAKGLLRPYELSVDTAASALEAIEKIRQGNLYDIVFMDHIMPGMDGMEAVKIIRNMGYTAPIAAMTATAMAGQAEKFLAEGFDAFIAKPIDTRQLNVLLNKLIRDKQSPETLAAARREKAAHDLPAKDAVSSTPAAPAAAAKPGFGRKKLMEVFTQDAEKAIAALERVCQNTHRDEDMQAYIITVHSMKGALAEIGETELSALALTLEQAGMEKNIAVMAAVTPAFLSALRALVERVKAN